MDMRAGAGQRLSDLRQRLPTVDQHVKRATWARRWVAGAPQRSAGRRFQLIDAADTFQPAMMMLTDCCLDALARPSVGVRN